MAPSGEESVVVRMASFGEATVHEVASEPESELEAEAGATATSAVAADYVPATALEARIAEVIRGITGKREQKPKFVKIQLQFPKVAAVFEKVRATFAEIDEDRSGTIELGEIKTALAKMGATVTDEQVESIFAAADEDDNSKLSFQEFLVFLCIGYLLKELPEIEGFQTAFATALDAFDVFDVANQGVIVLSEVQATLQDVGTPDTLVARMAELDKDGNGYVIFPEFLMAFCDWVGVDEEEDE